MPFAVKRTFSGTYGRAPKFLRFARDLRRSLADARKEGASVAHFHFFRTSPLQLLCVSLARGRGFRTVVTAHDAESFSGDSSPRLARRIYGAVDRVIAHDRVSRDELVSRVGVAAPNVALIPHGKYEAQAASAEDRASARLRLGLPAKGPLVLAFGQIKEVKGLDVLLRALPAAAEAVPNVRS